MPASTTNARPAAHCVATTVMATMRLTNQAAVIPKSTPTTLLRRTKCKASSKNRSRTSRGQGLRRPCDMALRGKPCADTRARP